MNADGPQPRTWTRRLVRFGGVAAAIVLGAAVFLDLRYELIRPAPQIDHATLYDAHPTVRVVIDPARSVGRVEAIAERYAGRDIPSWLIDLALPHSVSIIATPDPDTRTIRFNALLNARRLGGEVAKALNTFSFWDEYPEFAWAPERLVRRGRGAVTLDAHVAMDPDALDAVWRIWSPGDPLAPLPVDGRHLVEVVFDNRDGGAYLVVASLLSAYGIELGEEEESFSLTSLQFVTNARIELDLVRDDTLAIRVALDVPPEARHRMAVLNMKEAMDRGFESWGGRLKREYGLELTGSGTWRRNLLEYEFRLRPFDRAIDLLLEGKLF